MLAKESQNIGIVGSMACDVFDSFNIIWNDMLWLSTLPIRQRYFFSLFTVLPPPLVLGYFWKKIKIKNIKNNHNISDMQLTQPGMGVKRPYPIPSLCKKDDINTIAFRKHFKPKNYFWLWPIFKYSEYQKSATYINCWIFIYSSK